MPNTPMVPTAPASPAASPARPARGTSARPSGRGDVAGEGPDRTCLTSLLTTLEDDDLEVHDLWVTGQRLSNSSDAKTWW